MPSQSSSITLLVVLLLLAGISVVVLAAQQKQQIRTLASSCSEFSNNTHPELAPLTDGPYQGYEGGLYPGGSNDMPAAHRATGEKIANSIVALDANGNPDPVNGKVVLMPESVSNGFSIWHLGGADGNNDRTGTFMSIANPDPARNPKLFIAYGFEYQNGLPNDGAEDPSIDSNFYRGMDIALQGQGLTPQQVQIVWLFMPWNLGIGVINTPELLSFPADVQAMKQNILNVIRAMYARYPNIKLIYHATKGYTYGTVGSNVLAFYGGPIEPWNHDAAWAVKSVIADQINGDASLNYDPARGPVQAPWMAWGPYWWSYGDGSPRHWDGFVWTCNDVSDDGIHPTISGVTKVAAMLLNFFKSDSTATPWYYGHETLPR
jgi:hypothetical protein